MTAAPASARQPAPVGGEQAEVPGLPRQQISDWFARELPQLNAGDDWTAEVITGGLSNITYRLSLGERTVILRRPPLSGGLPKAHDMVREFTIQSALQDTATPVPDQLGLCTDVSVIGAHFYVMNDVAGQVLRSAADTQVLSPGTRHAVGTALIDALVAMHSVDYAAAGLGEFGRPDGYTTRQVKLWAGQWDRSATRELPDVQTLFRRLNELLPTHSANTIVHGDYKIDNAIMNLDAGEPRIAAILDWELATLGDPLADLGTFLTYWHDSALTSGAAFTQAALLTSFDGFSGVDELAQRYSSASGRDLSDLNFYIALGTMKLAVILEGVHSRYLGGQTVSAGYDQVGEAVPILVARALTVLG